MSFSLVYLLQRFLYRLGDFFHHWYVDASRNFGHRFVSFLERLDRTLAIRVTFRYLFHPLYKDYTILGRILGVVFRLGRIAIGVFVYLFFTALFSVFYLLWVLIPPLLMIYVGRNL